MIKYFNIPGLGDSGTDHWQSYFEKADPSIVRIQQDNFDLPDREQWIGVIENYTKPEEKNKIILIGHSLGCSTIAFWASRFKHRIKGALLVAPSDIEAPAYTFPSVGFMQMPLVHLGFQSIVVASDNDPLVSLERAEFFAKQWGSEFINIGSAGHINAASGYGNWQEGLEILKKLSV